MPPQSFVVLRSKSDTDVAVRLHSDLIFRILEMSGIPVTIMHPGALQKVPDGASLIFHYNDHEAIHFLKTLPQPTRHLLKICLSCDMYDFRQYLDLCSYVSFFVVPTELHRKILMSQVYTPVYTLPERVDPIVKGASAGPDPFPKKYSTRTSWFGYPESFYKGMNSLLPIIRTAVEQGRLDSFELILDETKFVNQTDFPIIPYSNEAFKRVTSEFDYCILSHFSLDLTINSYIKSPNKLITALMAGMIPICSGTPNYEKILQEFGLTQFLYNSPRELDCIISRLDPIADSKAVAKSGIVESLAERLSENALQAEFLGILQEFEQQDLAYRLTTLPEIPPLPPPMRPPVHFNEHLKDLVPSFVRAIGRRLGGSTAQRNL